MNLGIDSITFSNFITLADVTLDLKDKGFILLKGLNEDEPWKGENAVGKTLIGDGMSWLLGGETSREILANSVIGPSGKSCSVSANLEVGERSVQVSRYRKDKVHGNALKIFEGVDASHRRIDRTQDRLDRLIGCSWDLLRLSCFQYGSAWFSRMKAGDRARILDEIVGAEEADIPKRYAAVNKMLAEKKTALNDLVFSLSSTRKRIDDYEEEIVNKKRFLAEFDSEYNREIERRKKLIAETTPKNVSDRQQRVIELRNMFEGRIADENAKAEVLEKLNLVFAKKSGYEAEAQAIKREIKNLLDINYPVTGGMCRHCGNDITAASVEKLVLEANTAIAQRRVDLAKYDRASFEAETAAATIKKKLESYEDMKSSREIDAEIRHLTELIQRDNVAIETASRMMDDMKSYMASNQDLYNKQADELKTIIGNVADIKGLIVKTVIDIYVREKEINDLENLSNFYSPAGFRPFVMEAYAPLLSECSNYFYKDFTNNKGSINISTKHQNQSGSVSSKIDIVVNDGIRNKSFPAEWSAGESACIDLSLNFGLMRLASMRAAKNFKFLWLDEITNGLSDKWIGILLDILRTKFVDAGVTVLMTSHHPLHESNFDEVWTVVKKNGISTIRS